MSVMIGWGLAVLAIAIGYVQYGWQGVVLGTTVVVFWLLLQFSRAMRAMRLATQRPVGHVDNAVMFNARLHRGMALTRIIGLSRSLGRQIATDPETWSWSDASGATVSVVMEQGRLTSWHMTRPAEPTPTDDPA